jgi:hypothetical protein
VRVAGEKFERSYEHLGHLMARQPNRRERREDDIAELSKMSAAARP